MQEQQVPRSSRWGGESKDAHAEHGKDFDNCFLLHSVGGSLCLGGRANSTFQLSLLYLWQIRNWTVVPSDRNCIKSRVCPRKKQHNEGICLHQDAITNSVAVWYIGCLFGGGIITVDLYNRRSQRNVVFQIASVEFRLWEFQILTSVFPFVWPWKSTFLTPIHISLWEGEG